MATIAELLQQASRSLVKTSPTPGLDAELLLAHALQQPRTHLRAWPDKVPEPASEQAFRQLLEKRHQGVPVAYLLGYREFWSMPLKVAPGVLIPRPETELLVETALELIPTGRSMVAELGTGSGAVAIALALERPETTIVASDRYPTPLSLARQNALRLNARRIVFIQSDWLEALRDLAFDVIVSNPPYIAADDPHLLQDIRHEPLNALAAGEEGLDAIRTIVHHAPRCLKPGGWLVLEHGYDQASQVSELLAQSGFRSLTCHHDLQGHPRITQAQWSF